VVFLDLELAAQQVDHLGFGQDALLDQEFAELQPRLLLLVEEVPQLVLVEDLGIDEHLPQLLSDSQGLALSFLRVFRLSILAAAGVSRRDADRGCVDQSGPGALPVCTPAASLGIFFRNRIPAVCPDAPGGEPAMAAEGCHGFNVEDARGWTVLSEIRAW